MAICSDNLTMLIHCLKQLNTGQLSSENFVIYDLGLTAELRGENVPIAHLAKSLHFP